MKGLLIFSLLLFGVLMGEQISNWIHFEDPEEHIQLSFPHHPSRMSFDISTEGTEQLGKLVVYSAPLEKGLLMACVLFLPNFSGHELEGLYFKDLLFNHVISRMFYQPKVFKEKAVFRTKKQIEMHGNPGIGFTFTYEDNSGPHRLSGVAVKKSGKLYILFYLAAAEHYDEVLLNEFTQNLAL